MLVERTPSVDAATERVTSVEALSGTIATPLAPPDDRPITGALRRADADPRARLVACFDVATAHPTAEAMAALRAAVTDLVDRQKERGLTLDRVLATVDALLNGHRPKRWRPTLHLGEDPDSQDTEGTTYGRVLDWCARAYDDDAWW